LDTNVYDHLASDAELVDALVELRQLGVVEALIETHVQRDELGESPSAKAARDALPEILFGRPPTATGTATPTSEFVLDVSRLGGARLGNGEVFEAIRGNTDRANLNHARDALLLDTARAEDAVFVTRDRRLHRRGAHLGLRVWSWEDFRHHLLAVRKRAHD
jgi:hypothetical protein